MTSGTRTNPGRRRTRLALAGAVVVTALTAGMAGAWTQAQRASAGGRHPDRVEFGVTITVAPPDRQAQTPVPTRLGTSPRPTTTSPPPTTTTSAGPTTTTSPHTTTTSTNPRPGTGSKLSCTRDLCVFVLDKGRFTAFDAPGQGAAEFQRINDRGEIVGAYGKERGLGGYLRDRGGRFTEITVPGAASTAPLDLNDRGEIVGNYQVEVGGTVHAFLRDKRGGFSTIQVPGAVQTQAYGINNHGQVVGDYYQADGVPHGYLWERGRIRTIDGPVGTGATLTAINDQGQILGLYADPGDAPGTIDGFLLSRGRYTTIDDPDAVLTLPLGINDRGEIAGFSAAEFAATEDSDAHGFVLRRGAEGPLTRIDVPGAIATGAMGINDQGTIVGVHLNGNPGAAPSAQPTTTTPPGLMPPDGLTAVTGNAPEGLR